MSLEISLAIRPLIKEFTISLFPFSVAIEVGRFGLYSSAGWDRKGLPLLALEKHLAGRGRELFIGPLMVSVGISPSEDEVKEALKAILADLDTAEGVA